MPDKKCMQCHWVFFDDGPEYIGFHTNRCRRFPPGLYGPEHRPVAEHPLVNEKTVSCGEFKE